MPPVFFHPAEWAVHHTCRKKLECSAGFPMLEHFLHKASSGSNRCIDAEFPFHCSFSMRSTAARKNPGKVLLFRMSHVLHDFGLRLLPFHTVRRNFQYVIPNHESCGWQIPRRQPCMPNWFCNGQNRMPATRQDCLPPVSASPSD